MLIQNPAGSPAFIDVLWCLAACTISAVLVPSLEQSFIGILPAFVLVQTTRTNYSPMGRPSNCWVVATTVFHKDPALTNLRHEGPPPRTRCPTCPMSRRQIRTTFSLSSLSTWRWQTLHGSRVSSCRIGPFACLRMGKTARFPRCLTEYISISRRPSKPFYGRCRDSPSLARAIIGSRV